MSASYPTQGPHRLIDTIDAAPGVSRRARSTEGRFRNEPITMGHEQAQPSPGDWRRNYSSKSWQPGGPSTTPGSSTSCTQETPGCEKLKHRVSGRTLPLVGDAAGYRPSFCGLCSACGTCSSLRTRDTQEEQSQEGRQDQPGASWWGWAGAQGLSQRSGTGPENHLEGSLQFCLASSWVSCGGLLQAP